MSGPDASREANPFDQFDEASASGEDLAEAFAREPIAGPLPYGDAMDAAGGPTVAEIMAAADNPAPLTPHEVYCEHMLSAIRGSRSSGRTVLELNDTRDRIAAWVSSGTGRTLGSTATWIRLWRPDLDKGAVFVIDNLHPCREAELTVLSDRGVIDRGMIRDVCRWAFYGLKLWRVALRIPGTRLDLIALAETAKFTKEGRARGFYGGVIDADLWAMTAMDCPWLPPLLDPSSTSEASASSSLKVH